MKLFKANKTKRNEFIDKLNTMIHRNNNQEKRFMRYRNANNNIL